MLKRVLLFFLFDFLFAVMVVAKAAIPWGFWGHRHINYYAVFCLPEAMLPLFKTNVDYLTRHAVDADQRRYLLAEEAARHYIDLDHYENELGEVCLPQNWKTACDSFSMDTLKAHGIVPFQVYWSYLHLQKMFEAHDMNGVLKAAADLGHYVGDAHVPLHTTSNYNGQKTGQKGIHAFWESRIPELSGGQYSNFVPTVHYIDDPQSFIWEAVLESHRLLDTVFLMEAVVRERLGEEELYTIAKKGQTLQRVINPVYARAYEDAMHGMVERRYRSAIHALSSLWYTAWVNAGQPTLPFEKVNIVADTLLLPQDSTLVLPGHAE